MKKLLSMLLVLALVLTMVVPVSAEAAVCSCQLPQSVYPVFRR